MTLIIIVLLVVAVVFIIVKSQPTKKDERRRETYRIEIEEPEQKQPTITKTENGSLVINGKGTSHITLLGASEDVAREIMNKCDNGGYYDAEHAIRDILLANSIQVAEVNTFQRIVKPKLDSYVQELISKDNEWDSLGEMDKKDKRLEYIEMYMEAYREKDSTRAIASALTVLATKSPTQVPLLNEMIRDYGVANINTYCEYRGRKNPVISIPNSLYRKPLEGLVNVGLACTGNDMSVEELLSSLTLNELNELSGSDQKFSRKDKAIAFISARDDISTIIEKHIALRSLFALKPLPSKYQEFDFDSYEELLSYYHAVAEVVVSSYYGLSKIPIK